MFFQKLNFKIEKVRLIYFIVGLQNTPKADVSQEETVGLVGLRADKGNKLAAGDGSKAERQQRWFDWFLISTADYPQLSVLC